MIFEILMGNARINHPHEGISKLGFCEFKFFFNMVLLWISEIKNDFLKRCPILT